MTSKLFQSTILHQEMDLRNLYFDEVFSIQDHDQRTGRAKWSYSIPDDPEANLGGTSRVPDHLQAGFLYRVSVHQDLTEGPDDQGFQGYQCGLCRLPLPSLASLQAHLLVSWTHSTGCNRLYSDMIRLCPSPPPPLVYVSEEPSPSSPIQIHNNQQDQEADRARRLYAVINDLEVKLGSRRGRCTDHLQADFVRYVSSQASNNGPGYHRGYQGSEGYQCALCQLPFPSLAYLQAHLLDSWEARQSCSLLYSQMIRRCPSPPPPPMVVKPVLRTTGSSCSSSVSVTKRPPRRHAEHLYPYLPSTSSSSVSATVVSSSSRRHEHVLSPDLPSSSSTCSSSAIPSRKRRRDNDVSSRGAPRSPSQQPSFSTLSRRDKSHQAGPSLIRPMDNLQSYLPQPYCPQPSHSTLSWGEESHQASPSKRHRELEATPQGYPGPNCTARMRTTCKTKSKCKMLQRKALV
ncbi:hypothetical protein J4Q44_G00057480 [Coregonus suidteri]|uniref:C2H2-type domain-containing protein n=1 Tax=Coregonus suidteri TaxID=861788 RepID=A0AAN8M6L6_9TELE